MSNDHYQITVTKHGIDVVQASGLDIGKPLTAAEYDALIVALAKWRNAYVARGDVEYMNKTSTSNPPEWGKV